MDKIYIGKITSFHGIKGEIRIKSDFLYKEQAFKVNNIIYIDNINYKIISYRRHKDYEMIMLEGFNDLNSVMFLKNKEVYIAKEELNLKDNLLVDEDYIGLDVIMNDKNYGKVKKNL